MSMAVGWPNKARSRWRRLALGLAVALAGGVTLAVPSGTASASNTDCLNYPGSSSTIGPFNNPYTDPGTGQSQRFVFPDGHDHSHVVLTFWIHQITPTFNVAASTFVDNGTDAPITGLFSTTQSQTFTIMESVSTGITSNFEKTAFTTTVSQQVTGSITTSTTITASGSVPAHSRVNADFGVDAYNVTYDVAFWQWDQNTCWYHGTRSNVTANVPTTSQGWHLYPATPI